MQGFRLRYALPSSLIVLMTLMYNYHQAWSN
jgi:hypothetical protein